MQVLLYAWNFMETRRVTQTNVAGRTWLVLDQPLRMVGGHRPVFFMSDHAQALDRHGEWWHDVGQQRMYVCRTNGWLGEHAVEGPARVHGIVLVRPRNVHISVVRVRRTGSDGIVVIGGAGSSNIVIEACTIELPGGQRDQCARGVWRAAGAQLGARRGAEWRGVRGLYHLAIVNNIIEETGLVLMPYNVQDGIGIFVNHYGCHTGNEVSGNRVVSKGYIGIWFGGGHARAARNYVASTALLFGEGIGLYTGAWWGSYQHLLQNIIIDSLGLNAPYYRMPRGLRTMGSRWDW